MSQKSINQLLCASLVDKQFSNLLLLTPETAILKGYLNHKFQLTEEEYRFMTSIQAGRIEDFAQEIHTHIAERSCQEYTDPEKNQSSESEYALPVPIQSLQRVASLMEMIFV